MHHKCVKQPRQFHTFFSKVQFYLKTDLIFFVVEFFDYELKDLNESTWWLSICFLKLQKKKFCFYCKSILFNCSICKNGQLINSSN